MKSTGVASEIRFAEMKVARTKSKRNDNGNKKEKAKAKIRYQKDGADNYKSEDDNGRNTNSL